MEQQRRTILKTITWRIIAIVVTVFVTFIYSRDWTASLTISLTANVLNMFFYYVHERLWNQVSFGRNTLKPLVVKEGIN